MFCRMSRSAPATLSTQAPAGLVFDRTSPGLGFGQVSIGSDFSRYTRWHGYRDRLSATVERLRRRWWQSWQDTRLTIKVGRDFNLFQGNIDYWNKLTLITPKSYDAWGDAVLCCINRDVGRVVCSCLDFALGRADEPGRLDLVACSLSLDCCRSLTRRSP